MSEIIETKKRLGTGPVDQRTGTALGYGQLIACPFPEHEDSTASFGPYAGPDGCPRWKCLGCNWQGDVFDFVEKFDHLEKGAALKLLRDAKPAPVTASKAPAETPHTFDWTMPRLERAVAALAASQPAQAYLASRGITLETAQALTFGFESGFVIMPTFLDGTLVAVKRRNIKAKEFYKASLHKNVYHLFARDSINELEPVIVVESELDAAMLASFGFCAVSVDTAGHRFNPADTAQLKRAPLVILALDNDTAGYKCAAEIAKLIPEKQRLQIQLPPRVKDLGELYAKAPAEFPAHLRALIRAAETMRRGSLEDLLTEDELIDQQGVEIDYAVDTLIPDGKLTMLFGREKSCKSLFAYYLGKCVANGVKVLDNFSVKQMPAIYIDAEDGISGQYAGYMRRLTFMTIARLPVASYCLRRRKQPGSRHNEASRD
jgi:5S rRNA maturation endonuclease (ribonuclease M5)